eukprot:403364102
MSKDQKVQVYNQNIKTFNPLVSNKGNAKNQSTRMNEIHSMLFTMQQLKESMQNQVLTQITGKISIDNTQKAMTTQHTNKQFGKGMTNDSLINEKYSDPFGFTGCNDNLNMQNIFQSFQLNQQQKQMVRKASLMPLFREIKLNFADEQQMENGKNWGQNGRKFSTVIKQQIQLSFNEKKEREGYLCNYNNDSPLRAQIFEVIKESDERTSNNLRKSNYQIEDDSILSKPVTRRQQSDEDHVRKDLNKILLQNLDSNKKKSDNLMILKSQDKCLSKEIDIDIQDHKKYQFIEENNNLMIPQTLSIPKGKRQSSIKQQRGGGKSVKNGLSGLNLQKLHSVNNANNNIQSCLNNQTLPINLQPRSKSRKRPRSFSKKSKKYEKSQSRVDNPTNNIFQIKKCMPSVISINEDAIDSLPQDALRLNKIHSEAHPKYKSNFEGLNRKSNFANFIDVNNSSNVTNKRVSNPVFDKAKVMQPYNSILLSDVKFKDFYAESLYEAIFTFPKFQRTYSKNYKNVQMSFRKVSKKKKTIVFDIDETLVLATCKEKDLKAVDDQIFIKMTRFGGSCKAYLNFRPYLFDMLDELSKDFELILYTCGTASYAQVFAESVQRKRKYFNHVLSLTHCLYSMENDMFIKDLKILEEGRSLKDVVIVDNNIQSFFLQLSNGIPIYDYTGDKNDEVLLSLTEYLKSFLDVDDVRTKIDRDFKIRELLEEKADIYMSN